MSKVEQIEAEIEKLPPKEFAKLADWIQQRREVLSAYDAMKRGCGVVKKAPRDLATNKRHLAGMGR